MISIKQEHIDRIVIQIECEVDNIYDFGSDPDKNYLCEKIIENHTADMLARINDLYASATDCCEGSL